MKSSRQAIWIVGLTLGALALWTGLRPWLPRCDLAEINFQANLIRLQAWKLDPHPGVVLVGSSLTGRLNPSYFSESPVEPRSNSSESRADAIHSSPSRTSTSLKVANLALDGSGPEAGLRLLLQNPTPDGLPLAVLIEGHRLSKNWSANDELLLTAMASPSMALSGFIPGLRADTRPTSLLYNFVRRLSTGEGAPATPDTNAAIGEIPEPGWENRLKALIDRLRSQNVRVLIYRLPAGRENLPTTNAPDPIEEIARRWNVPYVNVARECERRDLHPTYSDGLHLAPRSARMVTGVLTELSQAILSQ